jgi:chemotaxis protein CheC
MAMDIEHLNSYHMDVLKEIGNIGSGSAITALAKMLNRKVDMQVPEVRILKMEKVNELLGDAETPVAGLLLQVNGDLAGDIMFVLGLQEAHFLVHLIMGKKDIDAGQETFDEMEISALKEIGNILAGSYVSALSTLTGMRITTTVPGLAVDMAGAILSVPAIEFGKNSDKVLFIETVFNEGNTRVSGNFFLMPDAASYEKLLKALGVLGQ